MDEIKEKELDPIEAKPEEPASLQSKLLRMALGYDDLMPINLTKHISVATIQGKEAARKVLLVSGDDTLKFFSDDAYPVAGMKIAIIPLQEGEGNPSTTNILDISGWDGCTVYQSGEDTSDPTETELDWTSTETTVYGGWVDPIAGKIYVDMAFTRRTSTYTVDSFGATPSIQFRYLNPGALNVDSVQIARAKCNMGAVTTYGTGSRPRIYFTGADSGGNRTIVFLGDSNLGSTKGEVDAWFAEHPFEVAYVKKTPTELSFDPETFTLVKGENNFWADCGPVEELTY